MNREELIEAMRSRVIQLKYDVRTELNVLDNTFTPGNYDNTQTSITNLTKKTNELNITLAEYYLQVSYPTPIKLFLKKYKTK